MGATVKIGGTSEWYSSHVETSQDSTPLDPSDSFGGTGTLSCNVLEGAGSKSMLGKTFEIVDSDRGTALGVVAAATGTRRVVGVQGHSRLAALVAERTALPHVGTLETYLTYLFGLCGITTGFDIDASIADYDVIALGFRAKVWTQIKKLCAAYAVEVDMVDGVITVRPPRQYRATRVSETGFRWSLDQSSLAKSVEAWFYPVEPVTDALVLGTDDLSPSTNLAAGAVHTFKIDVPFSLSSVDQPVAADSVAYDYAASSTYAVLDQFDQPVPAATWEAGGGRVSVEIADDTRGLRVTVVASSDRYGAPYRLAGVTYMGREYSTLRVIGTGVAYDRIKYSLPACNDDRATVEVGAESDNEYLTSWGHAHIVLLGAVRRHSGGLKTISGTAEIDGPFGSLAGARIREDLDEYRIRSVSVSGGRVSFTAESDTTVADIDAVWAGYTLGAWDAQWAGRPGGELDLRPLTPLAGVPVDPGPQPYPDTFYPDQLYPA